MERRSKLGVYYHNDTFFYFRLKVYTLTGGGEINHINKEHEPVYNKVTVTKKVCKNRGNGQGGKKKPQAHDYGAQRHLNIFTTNTAGLVNVNIDGLKSKVHNIKSNIITFQATHFRNKGNLKITFFLF